MKEKFLILTTMVCMTAGVKAGEKNLPLPGGEVIYQMRDASLKDFPMNTFLQNYYQVDMSAKQARRLYESGGVFLNSHRSFLVRGTTSQNAVIDVYEKFDSFEVRAGFLCTKRIGELEFEISKIDTNYRTTNLDFILKDYKERIEKYRCYIEK